MKPIGEMKLTKKRAITLHRRMWRWIGLKTFKEARVVKKREWFDKFGGEAYLSCYCCEYDRWFSSRYCECCPIDWGGADCTQYGAGLYQTWLFAALQGDWQAAGDYALQIAALPEREEMSNGTEKADNGNA